MKTHSTAGPVYRLHLDFPTEFPAFAHTHHIRVSRSRSNITEPHVHEGFEVGYIHRGRGAFMIGSKRFAFTGGDIIIINPTEPHIAYFAVSSTCTWMYFHHTRLLADLPGYLAVLDTGPLEGDAFANVFSGRKYPAMVAIVKSMVAEFGRKAPWYGEMIRGQLWTLLALLHRLKADGDRHFTSGYSGGGLDAAALRRLSPALDLMHRRFAEKLDNEGLAQSVNMSPGNFRRLFRRLTGMAPHDYLLQHRLSRAGQKLRDTDEGVEIIAAATGFGEPSAFRRAFKKMTGNSPTAWRKNALKRNDPAVSS